MKQTKTKPMYTIPQNVGFILKNLWVSDKPLLFYCLARVPLIVLLPLLGTWMSRTVVQLVTDNVAIQTLLMWIAGLGLAMLAIKMLNIFSSNKIEAMQFRNRFGYINKLTDKVMDMDYELIERPDGQTAFTKAFATVNSNDSGTQAIITQFIEIGSSLVGLIAYAAILFTLHPLIVIALTLLTVVIYLLNLDNNRWKHAHKDEWTPIDRKLEYINTKSGDFEQAKDTRLYGMTGWFTDMFENMLQARSLWWKREERRGFVIKTVAALLAFVRDAGVYGFLIWQIVNSRMTPADFVLYFAIIAQYSVWMNGLFASFSALDATSLALCNLRSFLDAPDRSNRGAGRPLPQGACEITFDHVRFAYQGSDKDTIQDMSFTIHKGEKLAIVGINGAGKTTLVKLLCGLYQPTSGRILLNGYPLNDYNRDELLTVFSAVFQDIYLLPVTMAQNISMLPEATPSAQVERCLQMSGLSRKLERLPDGMNTMLVKTVYEDAIDLSGGEKQKLALARALYKDASMLILDEPTAALDPIAENEMYMQYNDLTHDRTSLFISHRLSSTRFCDRILFLENGQIAESGSHDELMALSGKYAEMFEIQAHYYKEENDNVEAVEG